MRKKVILKVLFIVAIVVLGCSMVLLHHNKQYADTSGDWRLVLVDKGHYIPKDYRINLTRLNGKQVLSIAAENV